MSGTAAEKRGKAGKDDDQMLSRCGEGVRWDRHRDSVGSGKFVTSDKSTDHRDPLDNKEKNLTRTQRMYK